MTKPIIGVLSSRTYHPSVGPMPVLAEYVNRTYCAGVEKGGGIPLIIPVTSDREQLTRLLSLCQGLLLPGGEDVDPCFYGEDPLPVLGTVDHETDQCWIWAVEIAVEKKLPIFGICRGLQLANVALGGSLWQDLSLKNKEHFLHYQHQNRASLLHEGSICPDSRLTKLLGTESIYTNTMHHQCAKEPGRGLTVTARTRDGIPEAMESADGQILLVQWHPEELLESEPRMLALFEDLVKRALQNL